MMSGEEEEEEFVGILDGLNLESEAEPVPSEPASSIDAEATRRMDPFTNPSHVWLEVDYGDLDLDSPWESKLELCELFSELAEIDVDSLKRALMNHLWYEQNQFIILKRHFQLSIYVPHSQEWHRVAYDMLILECLNWHQISRQARYRFKLKLNLGVWPHTCGRP